MVRNINPMLRQELQNLDKDAASRKTAMKALKYFVKELDSRTIPQFLAQVSETKEMGSSAGEYTISLYEVLARTHGPKIVPQIGNIMETVVKTLRSSAGSVALHQACAKVVPTIARYGIDPTTPENKKRDIIHSLCKPLSDCLMGLQESLSSGAALCLKALVDSDNWRFASNDIVNEVCLRAAGALVGKSTQTHSLMSLIMALAKQNALLVEAYARLLLNSGLQILKAGVIEKNSQKRLSSIQMINFLMKSLDPRSIVSEVEIIIKEMENCESDQMGYVKGAAYEALLTAKRIASGNGSEFEQTETGGGSNIMRGDSSERYLAYDGTYSLVSSFASPESHTLGSFTESDSFHDSPISTSQSSCSNGYHRRRTNRKQWVQENGGVDVSLKDGLFSALPQGSHTSDSSSGDSNDKKECPGEFAGFLQGNIKNGDHRSTMLNPQRSQSSINPERVKIYNTPRKLISSLQDPNDANSEFMERKFRNFLSSSSNCDWSPLTMSGQNISQSHQGETQKNGYTSAEREDFQPGSESVSSTENIPIPDSRVISQDAVMGSKVESCKPSISSHKATYKLLLCLLFVVITILTSQFLVNSQEVGKALVPT